MTRNIKALGLTLVAAFAMSAFVASAAQANQPLEITAAEYPATLTGVQIAHGGEGSLHTFTLSSGRVLKCSTASFHGTITGPVTHVTIHPTYSNCQLNETFVATVTMEDCVYTFTNGTSTGTHTGTGQVSLVCPTGEGPTVHVFNEGAEICTYTIDTFTDKSGISYENTTTVPDDVDLTANVTGITVTRVRGSNLNCGGAHQTAIYKGNTTVRAYQDPMGGEGAQIGLTVSPAA